MSPSFYDRFVETKNYTQEMQECIISTVEKLANNQTNGNSPGMLLGKVQGGKTRTFIGIMALCFDKGYDVCVVLTKGTNALAEQTYQRFDLEFSEFVKTDELEIFDVMKLPKKVPTLAREKKIIFIAKKQKNNIDRLTKFFSDYPDMAQKRVLFIDDEADFASIGFKKDSTVDDGLSINKIAGKINAIRYDFADRCSFLQVTATPYSLYLQPNDSFILNNEEIQPIKPAFTSLVPIHSAYIGGKEYFELSKDNESIYSNIYIQVPDKEIDALIKPDRRHQNNVLRTANLDVFRQSVINYIIGSSIRCLQEEDTMTNIRYKSSFIIHISTGKNDHNWQDSLITALVDELKNLIETGDPEFSTLTQQSYNNFLNTLNKTNLHIPRFEDVISKAQDIIIKEYISITPVNSDNDVKNLLDRSGQLRLSNILNIFVGGQILDRGITIENLIGFFYGRNPKSFQQDTVLQHSRMYGARKHEDMAVTRFYTSRRIYGILEQIHEFDCSLRESFERGAETGDYSLVFIEKDKCGVIKPCAPNKILLTDILSIKPYKRFLPIGFQTKCMTKINKITEDVRVELANVSNNNFQQPFSIDKDVAYRIIDSIYSTYDDTIEYDLNNPDMIKSLIDRFTTSRDLHCLVRLNRNMNRTKNNGTAPSDAPDTSKEGGDYAIAKSIAKDKPCLLLLEQNGDKDKGWKGGKFWWVVLVAPENVKQAVFATRTVKSRK